MLSPWPRSDGRHVKRSLFALAGGLLGKSFPSNANDEGPNWPPKVIRERLVFELLLLLRLPTRTAALWSQSLSCDKAPLRAPSCVDVKGTGIGPPSEPYKRPRLAPAIPCITRLTCTLLDCTIKGLTRPCVCRGRERVCVCVCV